MLLLFISCKTEVKKAPDTKVNNTSYCAERGHVWNDGGYAERISIILIDTPDSSYYKKGGNRTGRWCERCNKPEVAEYSYYKTIWKRVPSYGSYRNNPNNQSFGHSGKTIDEHGCVLDTGVIIQPGFQPSREHEFRCKKEIKPLYTDKN